MDTLELYAQACPYVFVYYYNETCNRSGGVIRRGVVPPEGFAGACGPRAPAGGGIT